MWCVCVCMFTHNVHVIPTTWHDTLLFKFPLVQYIFDLFIARAIKCFGITYPYCLSTSSIAVFCFYYCFNSIFRERQFELLAFVAATILISLYVIFNFAYNIYHHKGVDAVKVVITSSSCISITFNYYTLQCMCEHK